MGEDGDIVRICVKSTDFDNSIVNFNGFKFRITDKGGARSESIKWKLLFSGVHRAVFVADISSYPSSINTVLGRNTKTSSVV